LVAVLVWLTQGLVEVAVLRPPQHLTPEALHTLVVVVAVLRQVLELVTPGLAAAAFLVAMVAAVAVLVR
jgi:hypothetical protein